MTDLYTINFYNIFFTKRKSYFDPFPFSFVTIVYSILLMFDKLIS